MAVLRSKKNRESITLLPLLQNKRETYFVDFSAVRLVVYRGKRGSYWRRAEIQIHGYTLQSQELGSAYPYINLCIN